MCTQKNCGCNDPCKPVICVSYVEDSCADRKLATSNTTHPTGYDNVTLITPEVNQISAYKEHLEFVNSPEPLSNIVKHTVLRFSQKFLDFISNIFKGRNVGDGIPVYKGQSIVGLDTFQNFKTLKGSTSINITDNTNDNTFSINETWLQNQIPEPPTIDYPVVDGVSVGTGVSVYDGLNTKKIEISSLKSNTFNISKENDGTILMDIINTDFNYLKSYYINFNYTPTINSPADGSIIRPFPTWDEARTKMIGNGTILNPDNTNVTFVLQTNATTALNPTINTLSVKFLNTKLTYTGTDTYMFDSEILYPLVPKDNLNEITESITLNLYGVGSLNRTTPGGYIRAIGAKRGLSTTTSNPNYIHFQIGENIDDILTCVEYTNYSNSVWEGDVLNPDGITLLGNNYNPPYIFKWTTQINPTYPLIYIKNNSFATFSYPIRGIGSLYIQTFVNSGLHVEDTNLKLNNLTIVPLSNYISVVQGDTFVADYPGLGIYEPKNAPAIYAKNTQLYINSILNVNTGTFAFHGYDKFFKIEGTFKLSGTVNYDTNYYIKTFADLTSTTQNYFEINGKTVTANLNSRINYLINSSINGDFNLIMPFAKLTGVKNISQNNSTNIIPITNGTLSSINNNPYLSGINNYVNDAGASVAGLLKNALYFNTTNNALDKI